MDTARFVIKTNPIGDQGANEFLMRPGDEARYAEVSGEDLLDLGVTITELDTARRGYRVSCLTAAICGLGELYAARIGEDY